MGRLNLISFKSNLRTLNIFEVGNMYKPLNGALTTISRFSLPNLQHSDGNNVST